MDSGVIAPAHGIQLKHVLREFRAHIQFISLGTEKQQRAFYTVTAMLRVNSVHGQLPQVDVVDTANHPIPPGAEAMR